MKPIDLIARRFGRLGVLRKVSRSELRPPLAYQPSSFWECECDCGERCVVRGTDLARGLTRSCGCYRHDRILETNLRRWSRVRPAARPGGRVAPKRGARDALSADRVDRGATREGAARVLQHPRAAATTRTTERTARLDTRRQPAAGAWRP